MRRKISGWVIAVSVRVPSGVANARSASKMAFQRPVRLQNILPERRLQLRQTRRARQQNFPCDTIRIDTRIPLLCQEICRTGFAAARTAGDSDDFHSVTTRKAAARIRRL